MFTQQNLFRPQALKHQTERLDGRVHIAKTVKSDLLCLSLLVFIIAAIAFSSQIKVARTQTISGSLELSEHISSHYADSPSQVIKVLVTDGDVVEKNQILAVLSTSSIQPDGRETFHTKRDYIKDELSHLHEKEAFIKSVMKHRRSQIHAAINEIEKQYLLHQQLATIAEQRKRLAQSQTQRYTQLIETNTVSIERLTNSKDNALAFEQSAVDRQLAIYELDEQRTALEFELQALTFEYDKQLDELHHLELEYENQLIALNDQYRRVIKATKSGEVTNLNIQVGDSVLTQQRLMDIVPTTQTFIAKLKIPAQTHGHINIGDTALVKVDAFPHQEYGTLEGQVINVGDYTQSVSPSYNGNFSNDSFFLLTLSLQQSLSAPYNNEVLLSPGMTLSADILLESRTLLEWFFEPLLEAL